MLSTPGSQLCQFGYRMKADRIRLSDRARIMDRDAQVVFGGLVGDRIHGRAERDCARVSNLLRVQANTYLSLRPAKVIHNHYAFTHMPVRGYHPC